MLISQDQKNRHKFQIEFTIEEYQILNKRTGPDFVNAKKILFELILDELYEPCEQRKE